MPNPRKTTSNENWGRVATNNGNRSFPVNVSTGIGADFAVDPLHDEDGRYIARMHDGSSYVVANSSSYFSDGGAYTPVAGQIINVGSTLLNQFWGHNSDPAATIFAMVFNRTTVPPAATPADLILQVPALSSFSLSVPFPGFPLSSGFVIAASSTDLIFTALAAPRMWAAAAYR